MPINEPADDVSRGDSEDGATRNSPGNSHRDGAGPEAPPDGQPAGPGLQTVPGWLPADLLEALSQDAPDGSDEAVAEAFCQGGPLDELPPGPTLTAFLIKAADPRRPAGPGASSGATGASGTVPPPLAGDRDAPGRPDGPDTSSGTTEDPGAPSRTEDIDVPCAAGSRGGLNAGVSDCCRLSWLWLSYMCSNIKV